MRHLCGAAIGGLVALCAGPAAAIAQDYPPIEDRDYAIDLYRGSVVGSPRIVGMGGAAVATAEGSAHAPSNPAAAAVRPTTSTSKWAWNGHFDGLSSGGGTDLDNNGIASDAPLSFNPVITAGLSGQYRRWGLAVGIARDAAAEGAFGAGEIRAESTAAHFALARSFREREITAGLGLRFASFAVTRRPEQGVGEDLFVISTGSLQGGGVWSPPELDLRVGASARVPFTGSEVDVAGCPPTDCEGYILPERVEVPWRAAAGVAWRWAETSWNREVDAHFRDERHVLVAADLVATGAVRDGHGLEAFAQGQLQPSGRRANLSLRAGAEYEWFPGRLRVRGGTYWEPSRFLRPDGRAVPGRLHVTAGFDVRLLELRLWSKPYRIQLSLTADAAERYGGGGLSFGFWR